MYRAIKDGKVIAEMEKASELAKHFGVAVTTVTGSCKNGNTTKVGIKFEFIQKTKICKFCHKEFTDQTKTQQAVYCSWGCSRKARTAAGKKSGGHINSRPAVHTVTKKCPQCGQMFSVTGEYPERQKYCGEACSKIATAEYKKQRNERSKAKSTMKKYKNNLSDVSKEALKNGTSYGEYVVEIDGSINTSVADGIHRAKELGISYQEYREHQEVVRRMQYERENQIDERDEQAPDTGVGFFRWV